VLYARARATALLCAVAVADRHGQTDGEADRNTDGEANRDADRNADGEADPDTDARPWDRHAVALDALFYCCGSKRRAERDREPDELHRFVHCLDHDVQRHRDDLAGQRHDVYGDACGAGIVQLHDHRRQFEDRDALGDGYAVR